MLKNSMRSTAAALLLALPLASAHGALISWNFSGTVTAENGPVFSIGDTVTGTLVFDAATARTSGNGSTTAAYAGAVKSFSLDGYPAATLVAASATTNTIDIIDRSTPNPSGLYIDQFLADLRTADGSQRYTLRLRQESTTSDPTCIESVALPTVPYAPLSCFGTAELTVGYEPVGARGFNIRLELTSIPEPGTLALLGLGLAGLAATRRRKQ